VGNRIGLNVSGTTAHANGGGGVEVASATGNNTVGGVQPGEGNVISGNAGPGVNLNLTTGNSVQGNFIGVAADGRTARPNETGIAIRFSHDNLIGDAQEGGGNVISGNMGSGVRITGLESDANVIRGNMIGTDSEGAQAVPNGGNGIAIEGGEINVVGGPASGEGNLISGNLQSGVLVSGGSTQGNVVWGNLIGTDATGTASLANGDDGVLIDDSPFNAVGLADSGGGNLISGNSAAGVRIIGDSACGNSLRGNRIGTDATGTAPLPNGAHGVFITGGESNLVGGPGPGEGNLVSGNEQIGVSILGPSARNCIVGGNLIGVDVSGTLALANGMDGIGIQNSSNNRIGGSAPGAGNVLSGHQFPAAAAGLCISGDSSGNTVQGNFIGTDIGGSAAIPNANGIRIVAGGQAVIGGAATGEGNVISGNLDGIMLGQTSGVVILGNLIGTDASGLAALGNAIGVSIGGSDNTIGGGQPGEGNIISGNTAQGVLIAGSSSTDNTLLGNVIGLAVDRSSPLGNGQQGLLITGGSSTTIGNSIGGNVIAHSGEAGVAVTGGTGHRIAGNSVHSNGGLGIDLGDDGVTANDDLDSDSGPNGLSNYPVISFADLDGSTLLVQGTLSAVPNAIYDIEIFLSADADPSGFGEGSLPVAVTDVATDTVTGDASFSVNTTVPEGAGRFVTATATDIFGPQSTSEFSPAVPAASGSPTVADVVALLLGLISDPGNLDVNSDGTVDAADVVTVIDQVPD
jgi:hypothetical protein